MRSLRLKNFRSLVDTGRIELRPLTVLVGANNSGKSSFLRFFPLLRQTYEARSASPLLWYGRDVDFGDFSQAVRRGADSTEIVVAFTVRGERWQDVVSTSAIREHDGQTYTASYTLDSGGHALVIDFDHSGSPTKLALHAGGGSGKDLGHAHVGAYTLRGELVPRGTITGWPEHLSMKALGGRLMLEELAALLPDDVPPDALKSLGSDLTHLGLESLLARPPSPLVDSALREKLAKGPALASRFRSYEDLRSAAMIIDHMHFELHAAASGCVYIGPFRAAPERFYRQQELSVGHMDPQGGNLAMFLRALSVEQLAAFSRFMVEHIGFDIRLETQGSNFSIMLKDDSAQAHNLIDMGYGFSQILPVVAQCWATASGWHPYERDPAPSIIAIEQPELHLHPHYQAKLADMFVGTIRAVRSAAPDTCILIETHSEPLLVRLGELVESGKLASEDVSVLLFEQDPLTKTTSVRQSTFSPDGTLTNWPIGFFAP